MINQKKIQQFYKSNNFIKKIAGINLLELMIGSSLGIFIIGVIIRVSFTVNDNLQLIKAVNELEASARLLERFFGKVLTANGYNILTNYTNEFRLTVNNAIVNNIKFPISFSGGNSNAINCSGELVPLSTNPQVITIFMSPQTATSRGYITCLNGPPPTGDGSAEMPLVARSQIADFYITLSAYKTNNTNSIANLPIIETNINPSKKYNPFYLNLAILLRSTAPVFNTDQNRTFANIFLSGRNFTTLDRGGKHLYKLVIIESPFTSGTISTNLFASILNNP